MTNWGQLIKKVDFGDKGSKNGGNGINELDFLCLFRTFAARLLSPLIFGTKKERIGFLGIKIQSTNCYSKILAFPNSVPNSNLFGCLLSS